MIATRVTRNPCPISWCYNSYERIGQGIWNRLYRRLKYFCHSCTVNFFFRVVFAKIAQGWSGWGRVIKAIFFSIFVTPPPWVSSLSLQSSLYAPVALGYFLKLEVTYSMYSSPGIPSTCSCSSGRLPSPSLMSPCTRAWEKKHFHACTFFIILEALESVEGNVR